MVITRLARKRQTERERHNLDGKYMCLLYTELHIAQIMWRWGCVSDCVVVFECVCGCLGNICILYIERARGRDRESPGNRVFAQRALEYFTRRFFEMHTRTNFYSLRAFSSLQVFSPTYHHTHTHRYAMHICTKPQTRNTHAPLTLKTISYAHVSSLLFKPHSLHQNTLLGDDTLRLLCSVKHSRRRRGGSALFAGKMGPQKVLRAACRVGGRSHQQHNTTHKKRALLHSQSDGHDATDQRR